MGFLITSEKKILDDASKPAFQGQATQDTNQGDILLILRKIAHAKHF